MPIYQIQNSDRGLFLVWSWCGLDTVRLNTEMQEGFPAMLYAPATIFMLWDQLDHLDSQVAHIDELQTQFAKHAGTDSDSLRTVIKAAEGAYKMDARSGYSIAMALDRHIEAHATLRHLDENGKARFAVRQAAIAYDEANEQLRNSRKTDADHYKMLSTVVGIDAYFTQKQLYMPAELRRQIGPHIGDLKRETRYMLSDRFEFAGHPALQYCELAWCNRYLLSGEYKAFCKAEADAADKVFNSIQSSRSDPRLGLQRRAKIILREALDSPRASPYSVRLAAEHFIDSRADRANAKDLAEAYREAALSMVGHGTEENVKLAAQVIEASPEWYRTVEKEPDFVAAVRMAYALNPDIPRSPSFADPRDERIRWEANKIDAKIPLIHEKSRWLEAQAQDGRFSRPHVEARRDIGHSVGRTGGFYISQWEKPASRSTISNVQAEHQRVKRETTRTKRFLRIFGIGKTAGHIIDDAVTAPGASVNSLAKAIANKAAVNERRIEAATVTNRLIQEVVFSPYNFIARIMGKLTITEMVTRANREAAGYMAVKRAYKAAANDPERLSLVGAAVAEVYPHRDITVAIGPKVVVNGDLGERATFRGLAERSRSRGLGR